MSNYFVYSNDHTDKEVCHREAVRRFHNSGETSTIHFHKHGEECIADCYQVPMVDVNAD